LFSILEQQVAPEFYTRNADNIPEAWIKKVRKSMATLTPYFSSGRTVREYAEKYYLPAADGYLARRLIIVQAGKGLCSGWVISIVCGGDPFWESKVTSGNDRYVIETEFFWVRLTRVG